MKEIVIDTDLFSRPVITDPCDIGDTIKITIRTKDATHSSVCVVTDVDSSTLTARSVCANCFIKRVNDILDEGTAFCPRNDATEFICGRGWLKSVNDIMEDI